MKKTPIIPVKLLEEEQSDIEFRRRRMFVVITDRIETNFCNPYVMTQCMVKDTTDGKNKLISFYRSKRNKDSWGTELYVGPNYVEPFDSGERSYSRNYRKNKLLPEKYKHISKILENENMAVGERYL